MYIPYLFLFIIYYIFFSVLGVKKTRMLKYSYISESTRIKYYTKAIIETLMPALMVFVICLFSDMGLADLGLRKMEFSYNVWFNAVTVSLSFLFSASLLFRMIACMFSEKHRYWAKRRYTTGFLFSHYEDIMNNLIIPHSKKQIFIYFLFSITGGICNEIVLRGFFYFILQSIFPNISMILILFLSSFAFGFLQSNLGFVGVIKTMFNSALLGFLYFVTGSVFPGMILHFLINFKDAFIFQTD